MRRWPKEERITIAIRSKRIESKHLLHAFSSDSSLQSGLPLQKSSLSTHSPLPHDSFPSGQTGSSVLKMGNTLRGSANVILVNGPTRRLTRRRSIATTGPFGVHHSCNFYFYFAQFMYKDRNALTSGAGTSDSTSLAELHRQGNRSNNAPHS